MHRLGRLLGSLILFAVLTGAPLCAQNVRGTLTGVVQDPSGAVIPAAKISIVQKSTNSIRSTLTNDRGEFQIPQLAPGPYALEVEASGFLKNSQEVVVAVNQEVRVTVEMQLRPGKTETVRVEDLLKRDSAAQSTVIENRKLTGLPLDGRNFFELSLLVPGTAPAAQGSAGSVRGDFAMNVSGAREDSNLFLLDGVYNDDPKLNGIGVQPPVDAIQEFEVQTSNYDASFGRNAGGQVNAALKSGTNQLHGTGYEFFRNAALDARGHFAPASEPAPKYQRNQFGFSLGGPIVRDRTFFFGDYEGTILREGITRISNVPTNEERNGDFSHSLLPPPINPLTGQPFPGNVIPSMFQSSVGSAIANLFPLPNRTTPGQNYVASPTGKNNQHQFDVRVDHMLRRNSELSLRYSFIDSVLFEPYAGPTFAQVPSYGNNVPRRAQNLLIGHTQIFSPALLNEARFAFHRVAIGVFQEGQGTDLNQQVGLPTISPHARDTGLSFIRITGFSPLGQEFNNPQASATNTFQVLDNVTYARGRSQFRFGFDFRAAQQNGYRDVQARGFLNFQGFFTGNPLADLLLGFPTVTGVARLDNPQHLRTESWNFFAQENYRLRSNLTLTAGLRYEFNSPPVDVGDRANLYDPATQSLVRVGTNGIPRSGYNADKNNFGPRTGVAWSPGARQSTVLRAGYGIYFDQSSLAPGEGLYFNAPYFDFRLFFSLPPQPPLFPGYTLTLADPFPSNFPLPTPPSALAYQLDLRTPYVQQWTFSVQQKLGAKRVLEVGYVGTKATRLIRARDINQPAPSTIFPNPRPNPQFDDITFVESLSNSTYHALQARFQQSYDFGLSLLASYTYSKSLDDASGFFPTSGDPNFPQNSYNMRAERGLSDFDTRQRLSLSYSYDFPYCREIGGRVVAQKSWKAVIFGGWATFGIITFQSGRPFTVALLPENDNSNTGRSVLGFGANDRPNLVGNPRAANPTAMQWFNTSAFALPPFGSFGNSGRNILEGPGLAVFNISLVKNFGLSESARLQFRAEAFNLLNRTNYDLPDNFFGSPTFGQILSAQNPRHLQIGLKVIF